jgi:hypothetical protein
MAITGKLNIEPELMTFGTHDDDQFEHWSKSPDCEVIPSNWVYSWKHEPFDWGEWIDSTTGLTCVIKRNGVGAWCGYAVIPEGHPISTADESEDYLGGDLVGGNPVWLQVHGGVTYHGTIGIPSSGERRMAAGFDCAHYGDRAPAAVAWKYNEAGEKIGFYEHEYRDARFAINEVRSLAKQIFFYRPLQQIAV